VAMKNFARHISTIINSPFRPVNLRPWKSFKAIDGLLGVFERGWTEAKGTERDGFQREKRLSNSARKRSNPRWAHPEIDLQGEWPLPIGWSQFVDNVIDSGLSAGMDLEVAVASQAPGASGG